MACQVTVPARRLIAKDEAAHAPLLYPSLTARSRKLLSLLRWAPLISFVSHLQHSQATLASSTIHGCRATEDDEQGEGPRRGPGRGCAGEVPRQAGGCAGEELPFGGGALRHARWRSGGGGPLQRLRWLLSFCVGFLRLAAMAPVTTVVRWARSRAAWPPTSRAATAAVPAQTGRFSSTPKPSASLPSSRRHCRAELAPVNGRVATAAVGWAAPA